MAWLDAIIGGASNLLGGMMGRDSVEDQQRANLEAQREFSQHGIRWKVADAKAAGLHPVYALGGSGAAYSPNPIIVDPLAEAIRSLGQNVAQVYRAPADRNQEVRGVPPSSAGYDLEDAAMGADYGYAGGTSNVARITDPDFGWDAWRFEQPKIQSARSGQPNTEAGPARPGLVEYEIRPGFRMKFPSGTSLSEAIESLENPLMWPVLLKINSEEYGPGWMDSFGRNLVPGYQTLSDMWTGFGNANVREAIKQAINPGSLRVNPQGHGEQRRFWEWSKGRLSLQERRQMIADWAINYPWRGKGPAPWNR